MPKSDVILLNLGVLGVKGMEASALRAADMMEGLALTKGGGGAAIDPISPGGRTMEPARAKVLFFVASGPGVGRGAPDGTMDPMGTPPPNLDPVIAIDPMGMPFFIEGDALIEPRAPVPIFMDPIGIPVGPAPILIEPVGGPIFIDPPGIGPLAAPIRIEPMGGPIFIEPPGIGPLAAPIRIDPMGGPIFMDPPGIVPLAAPIRIDPMGPGIFIDPPGMPCFIEGAPFREGPPLRDPRLRLPGPPAVAEAEGLKGAFFFTFIASESLSHASCTSASRKVKSDLRSDVCLPALLGHQILWCVCVQSQNMVAQRGPPTHTPTHPRTHTQADRNSLLAAGGFKNSVHSSPASNHQRE
eukprot:Gregarina_sp_Pseudo_9__5864@NODE_912_length_2066_cov_172_872718_g856_i0_p1_GENE_NODE_912_length_2066_cov_172_872718_g856_i0NODE_912_length_2066_cov_172_872718_g856_i0_p1_ORF_typecomplete_len354_score54_57_NODE_912_length_2066_cov_172_872718_g856_i05811642